MDYTQEDFDEISKIIQPYTSYMVYMVSIHYTTLDDFKRHPLTYEVLSASLEDVPLFIHSLISHVREIAKWRLEHNK